jgi:hypothetical protein
MNVIITQLFRIFPSTVVILSGKLTSSHLSRNQSLISKEDEIGYMNELEKALAPCQVQHIQQILAKLPQGSRREATEGEIVFGWKKGSYGFSMVSEDRRGI